jgi:uncharacterized protein YdcH (DUF465 family)
MKESGNENAQYIRNFNKHNELDDKIIKAEKNEIILTDLEIETLKKEKLMLKDEAYSILVKYKKEHNL